MTPLFQQYIGIDYSGAKTPTSSLSGLRVFLAAINGEPGEVLPPPSPRKYWTRREVAEWMVVILSESPPTLVGIDHGFSFPIAYFRKYGLSGGWDQFLDDFCAHWPTDGDHTYVDFIRDGACGNGVARQGNSRWRRLCETREGSAKSVFHFDCQGSVAKSTHSGIPWLRHMRRELGEHVHFWPFDDWTPPQGRHVVAEIYPSIWKHLYPRGDRTPDQHDAYAACRWMQQTDRNDGLPAYLQPTLSDKNRAQAKVEGWILGMA